MNSYFEAEGISSARMCLADTVDKYVSSIQEIAAPLISNEERLS